MDKSYLDFTFTVKDDLGNIHRHVEKRVTFDDVRTRDLLSEWESRYTKKVVMGMLEDAYKFTELTKKEREV
jgi:hypothetical protein